MPKKRKRLELSDPEVQEAKRIFEKARKECHISIRNPSLDDFNDLFVLFSNDCNTFTEIAGIKDCSYERIRQLYRDYFVQLFPNRQTGRARRRACLVRH